MMTYEQAISYLADEIKACVNVYGSWKETDRDDKLEVMGMYRMTARIFGKTPLQVKKEAFEAAGIRLQLLQL